MSDYLAVLLPSTDSYFWQFFILVFMPLATFLAFMWSIYAYILNPDGDPEDAGKHRRTKTSYRTSQRSSNAKYVSFYRNPIPR